MTSRTRIFVWIITALGAVQLMSSIATWHSSHPKLFLLYLSLSAICSYFQVRTSLTALAISVNLPIILLGIVQLNLAEAVAVGCVAGISLVSGVRLYNRWRRYEN